MIGFLNVNKPSKMSSASVVAKLKKRFGISKIGHLGTLDPLATGVLPIAIGKATRLFDYFMVKKKTYIARFIFGKTTDTLDSDGEIVSENNIIPTEVEINTQISKMVGKYMQIPPNFSAKSINGVRAYKLARSGVQFELMPKEVEIFEFEFLKKISNFEYEFKITCSSGTYIRAIARDLADKLNTVGYMSSLCRVKCGYFTIDNSYSLDELLDSNCNILNKIINIDEVFRFNTINISSKQYDDLINGRNCLFDYIITNNTFVSYNNTIIGLAETNTNMLKLKVNLIDKG